MTSAFRRRRPPYIRSATHKSPTQFCQNRISRLTREVLQSAIFRLDRRALLANHGDIEILNDLGDAGTAGAEDTLGEAAVALSAHRIATGDAASLPCPPERNTADLRVAIWY